MIEMLSKPIEQIGICDIESLIELKVCENEQIEFKKELPSKRGGTPDPWMSENDQIGDRAKNEILEEVTAFANAFGGVLLLGIQESAAKPPAAKEIKPIPKCAELADRLGKIFRDCVEPQLPLIEIHPVLTKGQCGVVMIRVGKSRMAPHRVTATRNCNIRRQDRCEKMTMREIQDMTLNVSRGLKGLEKKLIERRKRFKVEFQRFENPDELIGVRATAVPVNDEIRIKRVFHNNTIDSELLETDHKVSLVSNQDPKQIRQLEVLSLDYNWRPMIRAARGEYIVNSQNAEFKFCYYREIHCDGLIELGEVNNGAWNRIISNPFCLLLDVPCVLFANLMKQADLIRNKCGNPGMEYAMEVEIYNHSNKAAKVVGYNNCNIIGELRPGPIVFPRYPLANIDESSYLLELFNRDFYNHLGSDFRSNGLSYKIHK